MEGRAGGRRRRFRVPTEHARGRRAVGARAQVARAPPGGRALRPALSPQDQRLPKSGVVGVATLATLMFSQEPDGEGVSAVDFCAWTNLVALLNTK